MGITYICIKTVRMNLLSILAVSSALAGPLSFFPPVELYDSGDFEVDSYCWCVAEGKPGEIFVGNTEGLLIYDGYRWELRTLPSGIPVYSLLVDGDHVYAGGPGEFGYWVRNAAGSMAYRSLSAEVFRRDEDKEDVWTISRSDGQIAFHAASARYLWDGSRLAAEQEPRPDRRGILLPGEDGLSYVVTPRDGIFVQEEGRLRPFPTEADPLMRSSMCHTAVRDSRTGILIVGTHLGGMMLLSPEGKLLYRYCLENHSLPSNHIFGLFLDSTRSLWIASDKGIGRIALNQPIWKSEQLDDTMGSLHSVAYLAPRLYLGTSRGVWCGAFSEDFMQLGPFSRVASLAESVQGLSVADGQLFCVARNGTYEISPARAAAAPVLRVPGRAQMEQGIIHGKEVLLQAIHSGLAVYLREQGRWTFSHLLSGLNIPVKELKIGSDGIVWIIALYGGAYRIELDPTLTKAVGRGSFDSLTEGPIIPPLHLFRFKKRVLLSGRDTPFYTYDDFDERIVPFRRLNPWDKALSVEQLSDSDFALRFREGTLFVREHADSMEVLGRATHAMLGARKTDEIHPLVILEPHRFLSVRDNALAIYELLPENAARCRHATLSLKRFVLGDYEDARDSLLFADDGKGPRIPWKYRRLTLQYAFPRFGLPCRPGFRYRMKGPDGMEEAEYLGNLPEITFHHLREGRYSIHVEALSMDGAVLSSLSHSFVIRPPFHRSWHFMVLLLLLTLAIASAFFLYHRSLQKARLHLGRYQSDHFRHREELNSVRGELALKNAGELRWNDSLQQIKSTLDRHKQRLGKDYPDKYYREISALLDGLIEYEAPGSFERNVNLTYDNYLDRLKTACPKLTKIDLQYCAFIKMRMDNKEIAGTMRITNRGVEAARYRIKKKLGLPQESSLDEFLINF